MGKHSLILEIYSYPKLKMFLFNSGMISTAEHSYTQMKKQEVIMKFILPCCCYFYLLQCRIWSGGAVGHLEAEESRRSRDYLVITVGDPGFYG